MKVIKTLNNYLDSELKVGKRVLVSYQTYVGLATQSRVYITNKYFSVTTSRHINKWLLNFKDRVIVKVDQDHLDEMLQTL